MRSTTWKKLLFTILLLLPSSMVNSQDGATASNSAATSNTTNSTNQLSEQALKVLVSGIAFYPDEVIADIFAASQDMVALHVAAQGTVPQTATPELKRLAKDPQIIKQLDSYPATTARLALAARTQLADVWSAIDQLRAEFAATSKAGSNSEVTSNDSTATTTSTTNGVVPVPVRPLARVNAFMAGLIADDVVDEINDASAVVITSEGNTVAVAEGSAVVAVGENGAAGAVTVGDSTKFGAVAGGTTTTPNGSTVSGVGGVKGEVTKTENGGSYSKDSAGVVVNNSTGEYAAGKRSTSGSVTHNADGSTSFSRSAATATESSYGNTTINRDSSGTITGDGTGSFESNTTIESSRGDATISTVAGNGEINTTVSTENGTKEFSAGDGEIQNRPDSTDVQSKSAKTTEKVTNKNGQRVSRDQMDQANQMLAQSWGRLESHPKNQSARSNFQRNAGNAAISQRNATEQRAGAARGNAPANGQRSMSGQRGNTSPSPAGRGNNRGGGRPGRGR